MRKARVGNVENKHIGGGDRKICLSPCPLVPFFDYISASQGIGSRRIEQAFDERKTKDTHKPGLQVSYDDDAQ